MKSKESVARFSQFASGKVKKFSEHLWLNFGKVGRLRLVQSDGFLLKNV